MQHPHYPDIDPVIVSLGPLAIRWYGLAYLAAFVLCWWLGRVRAGRPGSGWSRAEVSDVVFYGAVGAILGGRMGYTVFYGFEQLLRDPLFILRVWEGGMSFHGGLIGAIVGLWWFGRKTGRHFLAVADFAAPLVPLGLGLGRLGNFANTELPGRATDSVFGLIYPCAAPAIRQINPLCVGQWESFARHPSSLYQAFSEGLLLFVVVWLFSAHPRPLGMVSGVFLSSYGAARFVTEFFRVPDAHLGFVALDWMTMGQLLSIPMIIFGSLLILWARQATAARTAP
ncbi:MAG: prolipoprotein diacylglyceryl transferase [Pseudomonadales bacterium]